MIKSGMFYYKGQNALRFVLCSNKCFASSGNSAITYYFNCYLLKEVNDASHLRAKVVRPYHLGYM